MQKLTAADFALHAKNRPKIGKPRRWEWNLVGGNEKFADVVRCLVYRLSAREFDSRPVSQALIWSPRYFE
jgi:hypothetical protein